MTNYEKIRSMPPEEMADIIMCPFDGTEEDCKDFDNNTNCNECCLKWLEREAESCDHEETLTTSRNAWELIHEKALKLESEYYACKDMESVNSVIRLQNLLQYFKEELTEE